MIVEPGQELEALALRRKGLRRPVGDARRSGTSRCLSSASTSTVPSIGAGDHLVEARAPSLDQLALVGVTRHQLARRLGERAPGILALVPLRRADVGEEILHRRVVAVEQLAVEMARIPVAAARRPGRRWRRCALRDASVMVRRLSALAPMRGRLMSTLRRKATDFSTPSSAGSIGSSCSMLNTSS